MNPCRRSCIILVWKFWICKILEKWSPTSKLCHIKLSNYPDSRYIFSTCREPVCPPYLLNLFFDIFKSFIVFIILSIWWYANFADLSVRLRLSTFQIIFPRFLRTGISSDFNSIFIDWVSEKFFPGVFSPWSQKKTCKNVCPKLVLIVIQYSLSVVEQVITGAVFI